MSNVFISIGIDPGSQGAWVAVTKDEESKRYIVLGTGSVTNSTIDIIAMADSLLVILEETSIDCEVFVEIPKTTGIYKSKHASYQQGFGHGAIITALSHIEAKSTAIDPNDWQIQTGVKAIAGKKSKAAVDIILNDLLHERSAEYKGKKAVTNDGKRDAALLAIHGYRLRNGIL